MKILHTSDWHLGHMLYNYDRTAEQNFMLKQMVELVQKHRPDVFLVAGDIFHTSAPSSSVQTMLAEAVVDIHRAFPEMAVVLTAGNHDSAAKHEIFRTPWKALNVHAVGYLDKDHLDSHIIKVEGKGYVVAVPYCYDRNMPENFFQELLDRVAEQNTDNLPVVLSAHLTVAGCDYAGHDHASETNVGGIDSYALTQMGTGYDYLALGHIHKPQFIHSGHHNVRYSGTPLPVSFDETSEHSITIVDIPAHGEEPQYEVELIANPYPLVTLPQEGFADWETAKELLRDFPDDDPSYIRLNVEVDGYLPGSAAAEAQAISQGKKCRFCHINARRKKEVTVKSKGMTISEFKMKTPLDVLIQYAKDTDKVVDEQLKELFTEAERQVKENKGNN